MGPKFTASPPVVAAIRRTTPYMKHLLPGTRLARHHEEGKAEIRKPDFKKLAVIKLAATERLLPSIERR